MAWLTRDHSHLLFPNSVCVSLPECLCTVQVPGALGGHKKVLAFLGLELGVAMSHLLGGWELNPHSCARAVTAFSHQAFSSAPEIFFPLSQNIDR